MNGRDRILASLRSKNGSYKEGALGALTDAAVAVLDKARNLGEVIGVFGDWIAVHVGGVGGDIDDDTVFGPGPEMTEQTEQTAQAEEMLKRIQNQAEKMRQSLLAKHTVKTAALGDFDELSVDADAHDTARTGAEDSLYDALMDAFEESEKKDPWIGDIEACSATCPGWGVFHTDALSHSERRIQRCDACERFEDDDEALAHAVSLLRDENV